MHSREKQDSCETFLFSGSKPEPFFSLKNNISFSCRKNKNPEDSWGILNFTLFYEKKILPENRKMQPRSTPLSISLSITISIAITIIIVTAVAVNFAVTVPVTLAVTIVITVI
jgi:hypothetical protein